MCLNIFSGDTLKHHSRDTIPVVVTPLANVDTLNRFLTINRIFILGNKITREHIIQRELTFRSGDLVHSSDLADVLELDRKKLMNSRLFNTVSLRPISFGDSRIDILIEVNERWYIFPAPVLELADRNFNEWVQNYNADFKRVNYGLRAYNFNTRGRNETLRLIAQLGFYKRFELTYRIPYLDKKQKQGLVIDFDYNETKNVAIQTLDHKLAFLSLDKVLRKVRGFGITYTYRNSFYLVHALKADYHKTDIAGEVASVQDGYYLLNGRNSQQTDYFNYTITYDRRDYNGYPLQGKVVSVAVTTAGLLPGSTLKKSEFVFNASRYFELGKGYYLSGNTVGYVSTTKNLPYYNYSSVGYRRQVIRGYEVYVIEGPYQALVKTTLKKRLYSRVFHWNGMPIDQFKHMPIQIFLKTYADAAYVESYPGYTNSIRLNNRLLTGYGAGIDIVGAYDMVIRLEYSFNNQGDHGFFLNIKREF